MPYKPPDRILRALLYERFVIINVIDSIINASFQKARVECNGRAGEVEKLVYFFVEGLPRLEAELNTILQLHHIRLTISGIFCHQTPKVCSLTPSYQGQACELADIAFISAYHRMVGWGKRGIGNALLCQSKEVYSPGSHNEQEYLYQEATSFEYIRTAGLTGSIRNLSYSNNALWVWQLSDWPQSISWPFRLPWRTSTGVLCRPWFKNSPYALPFAFLLFDLMLGMAGRGVASLPSSSPEIGWSRIIHDLITVTATKALNCKSAPIVRNGTALRGQEAIHFLQQYCYAEPVMLLRCSLAEFLDLFDESYELQKVGRTLEAIAERDYEHKLADAPPNDFIPIKPGKYEGDSPGGSFIVFRFSEGKE